MDGGGAVCADLSYDYDVFYMYICDYVFVHLLSMATGGLNFSFEKEKFSKRN